jgi:hypothetical protein
MDYGFVPVTDGPTGLLHEMVGRRVPQTTMRDASALKGRAARL